MITGLKNTIGIAGRRSPCQARLSWFDATEQITVYASLPRNGFPKLESIGGLVIANHAATFSNTMYRTIDISATWSSGRTASLTATVDGFYGDATGSTTYSWQTGASVTNGAFAELTNNVKCCGLAIANYTGDTNPQTAPTNITIAADGLSATLEWISGGNTVLTVSITLSNGRTLADSIEDCTGLLQYATLLDEYYAPDNTYSVMYADGGGNLSTKTGVRLVFPSKIYSGYTDGTTFTNHIGITPKRGETNGVIRFSWGRFLACAITNPPVTPIFPDFTGSNYYKQTGGGFYFGNSTFIRMLFAYGQNNDKTNFYHGGGINSICSAKSAIRASVAISGGISLTVNTSTGANTTGTFTPPNMSSVPGLYLFDPVPLMSSPPTGYNADPSGGGLNLESLSPIDGSTKGSCWWEYTP